MIRVLEVAFEGVGVLSGRQEGWKFNFSFKKVVSVVQGRSMCGKLDMLRNTDWPKYGTRHGQEPNRCQVWVMSGGLGLSIFLDR